MYNIVVCQRSVSREAIKQSSCLWPMYVVVPLFLYDITLDCVHSQLPTFLYK